MTARMTGDRELDRFFAGLPDKLQRGAIRKGVRAGGSAMIKEVRQNIGRMLRPGRQRHNSAGKKTSLKRSVGQRPWSLPHRGIIGSVVGPRWPEGAHGHLVEFGHRIVTRHGRDTGHRARPIPYQRSAQRSARSKVLAAQSAKLKQAIAGLTR